MNVTFYLDQTGNKDEDGDDELQEMKFTANFSYQPDEYQSNGTPSYWYLDGDILDSNYKVYTQSQIDELHYTVHGDDYPWSDLEEFAAEQASDMQADYLIERYEDSLSE